MTVIPLRAVPIAQASACGIGEPELVIEAIRQVVEGVRNPDTWEDLTSCCAD